MNPINHATAPRCSCCRLQQTTVGDRQLCPTCRLHQSDEIHQTAKRHREHEVMLRERLRVAREWASEADAARKEFGDKMHWALRSRDRTIRVLRKINDAHELRGTGQCSCQRKGCKIGEQLADRGIQTLIVRVDDYEAEQREYARLFREGRFHNDPDAWDELMRLSGADGPTGHERRAGTG